MIVLALLFVPDAAAAQDGPLGQCLHAKENRIREEGLIKDHKREKGRGKTETCGLDRQKQQYLKYQRFCKSVEC